MLICMTMPWVGYVRVSHVGGRDGDSFRSPDDQAAAINGWARTQNEPVIILTAELDASGGDRNRPILAEAIKGIEQGKYRGLVVAYLSRASRSVSHLLELWDRIEAAGGQVIAVSENIDTSTPAGRLTRTMLAAIAEHELDLHRDRFDAQRASATERGVWQRAIIPIGYDKHPDTRRLVLNKRAKEVRAAFKAVIAGKPMTEVGTQLGVSTSGARHIIGNRVYLGELTVGAYTNTTAHPAIVTEDVFASAQRPVRTRKPRIYDEAALLAGISRCVGCGNIMSRSTVNGGRGTGARYAVYTCRGRYSNGRCTNRSAVMCHLLDTHVEAIAMQSLKEIEAAGMTSGIELDEARARLASTKHELAEYLAGVSAADVGAEAFGEGARQRRDAMDAAQSDVSRLIGVDGTPDTATIIENWPELTVTQRNHVLRGLLEVVTVRPGRVPVSERSQVIRAGAGIVPDYAGGSVPRELKPLDWLADNDPRVLRLDLT